MKLSRILYSEIVSTATTSKVQVTQQIVKQVDGSVTNQLKTYDHKYMRNKK
jgi:hypothetical protein